jgi:hypothetical protein
VTVFVFIPFASSILRSATFAGWPYGEASTPRASAAPFAPHDCSLLEVQPRHHSFVPDSRARCAAARQLASNSGANGSCNFPQSVRPFDRTAPRSDRGHIGDAPGQFLKTGNPPVRMLRPQRASGAGPSRRSPLPAFSMLQPEVVARERERPERRVRRTP